MAATSRAEALERNRDPVHPRLQGPLQDIDRALVARRHLRHCTYAGTYAGAWYHTRPDHGIAWSADTYASADNSADGCAAVPVRDGV